MLVTELKLKLSKQSCTAFRVAEVDIMYGQGISKEGEVIDLGVENDIVDKSGAWYSYNGDRMGQGKENVKHISKKILKLKKKSIVSYEKTRYFRWRC